MRLLLTAKLCRNELHVMTSYFAQIWIYRLNLHLYDFFHIKILVNSFFFFVFGVRKNLFLNRWTSGHQYSEWSCAGRVVVGVVLVSIQRHKPLAVHSNSSCSRVLIAIDDTEEIMISVVFY